MLFHIATPIQPLAVAGQIFLGLIDQLGSQGTGLEQIFGAELLPVILPKQENARVQIRGIVRMNGERVGCRAIVSLAPATPAGQTGTIEFTCQNGHPEKRKFSISPTGMAVLTDPRQIAPPRSVTIFDLAASDDMSCGQLAETA